MKRFIYFLIITLLLSGCTSSGSLTEKAALENYQSTYRLVQSEEETVSSSEYFSISATMTKLADNQYRYDVFIDEPTIAMRDIVVIVIEDNIKYEDQPEMMPSIGIFDPKVKLYPNQIDADLGYYKGINLNRVISNSLVNLKVLVQFTDSSRMNSYHEVINLFLKYE